MRYESPISVLNRTRDPNSLDDAGQYVDHAFTHTCWHPLVINSPSYGIVRKRSAQNILAVHDTMRSYAELIAEYGESVSNSYFTCSNCVYVTIIPKCCQNSLTNV